MQAWLVQITELFSLQISDALQIVPLASATFGTNFMEVFKVDKDHSGLNKCPNSEDPLYKVLTVQLHKIRP